MVRPHRETIDAFMSITGVSETAAIQRLEEHHGNLNEAINAHFTEGERNISQEASSAAPHDDVMDIDDPVPVESCRPRSSLPPFARDLNHFAAVESNFTASLFDTDGNETAHGHRPEIRGTAILDDIDDDKDLPNVHITEVDEPGNQGSSSQFGPSAPTTVDVPDYSNDIEEEMIRVAIEASKQDAALSNQQHGHLDLPDLTQPVQPHLEDAELAHAVSLSLQTAEKEKVLRELEGEVGASPDEMGKLTSSDGRQPRVEIGSTSTRDETEDIEELQLTRHRKRRVTSSSADAPKHVEGVETNPPSSPRRNDVEGVEINPPSSPQRNDTVNHSRQNGSDFPSDEWAGISPEEHDEAVMLEAAMFGGIPEGSAYHFPYVPHQLMQNGLDRNMVPHPRHIPRQPSPSLTAQRLIREQQDDEYVASLEADREKELKAKAESEAASAEERRKEDELHRRLQEEQEIERQLTAKEAYLPQEPTEDENAITLLVRMPDGSRRGRRFHKSDTLQYVFDFIDVGRGVRPGSYRLVRPYPRRAFTDGDSTSTLNELGLTSKQEALYLELI